MVLGTKRRSVRQAASRKRSLYVDPDTDDDFGADLSDDGTSLPAELPPPRKRRKPNASRRSKPQTRSRAKAALSRPASRPKGKSAAKSKQTSWKRKPRKPRKTHEDILKEREFKGPSDGRIPDWCSLPPDILRDIFVFASHPLDDGNLVSWNAVWLLKAASTCRAFSAPALEAFYQAPALQNQEHPHSYLGLLQKPDEKRYLNYNVKAKSLVINVRILAYQASHKGPFDIGDLIPHLPRLQHFEIRHPIDLPPFRPFKLQKWQYPVSLFSVLENCGRRLKSWRWHRDMIPQSAEDLYDFLTAHHVGVFERVQKLTMCGFSEHDSAPRQLPLGAEPGDGKSPELASSIAILHHLQDLTFISCDLVRANLLRDLPKTLHRLELTNCREFNSDMLAAFLQDGGAALRELVLLHNPALDLAFLPSLKSTCPALEVLKVDLSFFAELHTVNDAEPLFDYLLMDDEIPTWPTTLRQLDLIHLQKFDADPAKNLFRSLVDSARDLPDLRRLVIHSHISIPWRDRAGFRDEWIDRLQRIYLRRAENPLPYLGSLRQFRLWKQGHVIQSEPAVRHRLAHVAVSTRRSHTGSTDDEHDHESPAVRRQPRRSARVTEKQASVSATPTPASEESDPGDHTETEDIYVQGRCDVVDIRIDNQRPRENQFTEGDFLDSEQSGDEDWHEGDDLVHDEGYAW